MKKIGTKKYLKGKPTIKGITSKNKNKKIISKILDNSNNENAKISDTIIPLAIEEKKIADIKKDINVTTSI